MHPDEHPKELLGDKVFELLRNVITQSHPHAQTDVVARALLFFLLRVSNTWRSMRTLDKNTTDDEGPMVDAGALLRVMFDAYLQAEYIASDEKVAVERANDYLDFEHVEKYKRAQRVTSYDNPFAQALKASPHRPTGEVRLQQEYNRVKARYLVEKRQPDGTIQRGPRMRRNWYSGTLADIARSLGKSDEYDILLATFHGCVHSSAWAVRRGPVISREHILDWASTIAARIARLSVEHNRIVLDELHEQILAALCRPYCQRANQNQPVVGELGSRG